jgi:hypothetical protein
MPPQRKTELVESFREFTDAQFKGTRAVCHHCQRQMAKHATNQRNHLLQCPRFKTIHTARYEKFKREVGMENPEGPGHGGAGERLQIMPNDIKLELDLLGAMEVFADARPFTLLSTEHMVSHPVWGRSRIHSLTSKVPFLQRLASLGGYRYTPPHPAELRSSLLSLVYDQVKHEVDVCVAHEERINIVFDESKDQAGHRINNMSLVTRMGAFYYRTDDVGETRQTAENVAAWAIDKMGESVGGQFERINSVATDTCADMRAVWRRIKADPRTSHVFCVPCDSHGLQLLIGDLIEKTPTLKAIKESAETIASTFKNSPLQYAILHRHQQACYGRRKAFVLAVATRWGTQAGLVNSVNANKDALLAFVEDPASSLRPAVREIIRTPAFWVGLWELGTLLAPIHAEQKQSESTRADVGKVWQRWDRIEHHITACTDTLMNLQTFKAQTIELTTARRATQGADIDLVAFLLNPSTTYTTTEAQKRQVLQFFRAYSDSEERAQQLRVQWRQFCAKEGPFNRTNCVWEQAENPLDFWTEMKPLVLELSILALRLFSTPANSVPSERSFSVRNLIQDRKRSS